MGTTLLPPPVNTEVPSHEISPSDIDIVGGGGPVEPGEPVEKWYGDGEPNRDPRATPLSAYHALTFFAIVTIVMLFAAMTAILEGRWVDSEDWVSVSLPHILYLNTFILPLSSFAIEMARRALRKKTSRQCSHWLGVTLLLGLAFVGGQLCAWRELVARGFYLASNPGSFFIYMITGTHALHVLGGITLLAFVALFLSRWKQDAKKKTAVAVVAFYWHFMDALWIYLLALLFVTVQR